MSKKKKEFQRNIKGQFTTDNPKPHRISISNEEYKELQKKRNNIHENPKK